MGSHWWDMANQKLKGSSKINVFKLHLNEPTNGKLWIFRGIAFQTCEAA